MEGISQVTHVARPVRRRSGSHSGLLINKFGLIYKTLLLLMLVVSGRRCLRVMIGIFVGSYVETHTRTHNWVPVDTVQMLIDKDYLIEIASNE